MEHECDSDTNHNCSTRNDDKKLDKGAEGVGNQSTSRDYSNYNIVEVG